MDLLIKKAKELIATQKNSDFYNIEEQRLLRTQLKNECTLFGGIDGVERKILQCNKSHPFKVIQVSFKKNAKFTHSDLLGSMMALGIKRNKTGDIILATQTAYVIVKEEIASYILLHLTTVGKHTVTVEKKETTELELIEKEQIIRKINVPALRLDSIVACAFKLARSKSVTQIKNQKVLLNYQIIDKPSYQVKEGDIISIRKKGRIHIKEILSITKKGRLNINIVIEK